MHLFKISGEGKHLLPDTLKLANIPDVHLYFFSSRQHCYVFYAVKLILGSG